MSTPIWSRPSGPMRIGLIPLINITTIAQHNHRPPILISIVTQDGLKNDPLILMVDTVPRRGNNVCGTRAATPCTIMNGIQPDRDLQILAKVTLPRRRNTNNSPGVRKAGSHRLHPLADTLRHHELGPPMSTKLILSIGQHPKVNNFGNRRRDHARAGGTLAQDSPDNPPAAFMSTIALTMLAITTLNNTSSKHRRLPIHQRQRPQQTGHRIKMGYLTDLNFSQQ